MAKSQKQTKQDIRDEIELLKFEFDDLLKGNHNFFFTVLTPFIIALLTVGITSTNSLISKVANIIALIVMLAYNILRRKAIKSEMELKSKILLLYAKLLK